MEVLISGECDAEIVEGLIIDLTKVFESLAYLVLSCLKMAVDECK